MLGSGCYGLLKVVVILSNTLCVRFGNPLASLGAVPASPPSASLTQFLSLNFKYHNQPIN
jgi:hypothetical protein